MGMKHRSELGPGPLSVPRAFAIPLALAKVFADVPRFQPRGVDCGYRRSIDQASRLGTLYDDHLSMVEDPPFSASGRRRCAA